MRLQSIVGSCLLCLIAVGCSSNTGADARKKTDLSNTVFPAPTAADVTAYQTQPAEDAPRPLGFLLTRESIIRIESGQRFSLFELSGRPIALSLSKAQLQDSFPRLHRAYESAVAESQTGSVTIDASTNVPQMEVFK